MVTPGGLVVLTDRRSAARPLTEVVRAVVRGGAEWVILREKDLGYAERAAVFGQLRSVVPPGRLIVAGPDPLGGAAVHLAGGDPVPAGVELVGRSWHGTEDLSGVDYVTISPVYPTSSKPGYGPALGAPGAAGAASRAGVPWLALGGISSAGQAAECAAAGAAGIAVMGAVMRSPDPEVTARELSEAFAGGREAFSDVCGGSAGVREVSSGVRGGSSGGRAAFSAVRGGFAGVREVLSGVREAGEVR
ncbi:thiamine phosphate synthase [Actinoplanes sp. NPDC051861]|uniref:thiamine phosphate synthase n=1 Tax=Actinoplanes sp. NPDC051861 TaxID=3155170 RepID=UPI0034206613